jgi:hypothetical protein
LSPSKIASILADISKQFPNLSQETLEKLSTVEGLKNRKAIIESLSEEELLSSNFDLKDSLNKYKSNVSDIDLEKGKGKITEPFKFLMTKSALEERGFDIKKVDKIPVNLKTFSELEKEHPEIIKSIIDENTHLDPLSLSVKIKEVFPDYEDTDIEYSASFMKAMEEEINSGKTQKEKDLIRKQIQEVDLIELQNTGSTSDISKIKSVIRENYTHNSLLKEIKNKYEDNNNSELNKIIDKGKNLQSLEDLTEADKERFESETLDLPTDELIDILKNRTDYAEDSYIDHIITANIDKTIKKLIKENPKGSKQELIENLIKNNPENKEKILSIVSKNMNEQIEILKNKFSEKEIRKMEKVLKREDLKELQSLAETRTEDQIRALKSVNTSHNKFLNEIKSKASQSSLRKSIVENPSGNERLLAAIEDIVSTIRHRGSHHQILSFNLHFFLLSNNS